MLKHIFRRSICIVLSYASLINVAKADFCESLLDHFVQDTFISFEDSSKFSQYLDHQCRQFNEVRDNNSELTILYDSISFGGSIDEFKSVYDLMCRKTTSSSTSRDTKLNFVEMLNPSFGRAIESCADNNASNPALPVYLNGISTSADGTISRTEIKFTIDTTVNEIINFGFEECKSVNFTVGEPIIISSGNMTGYVICQREKGSDRTIFEASYLDILTNHGAQLALNLPEVREPEVIETASYFWERGPKKRQSFEMARQCDRSEQRFAQCDANNVGIQWAQLARPSASLPSDGKGRQGINFSISGDGTRLTINGGTSCHDVGITTEDGYAFTCKKETRYILK